jgi:hypothetical protein
LRCFSRSKSGTMSSGLPNESRSEWTTAAPLHPAPRCPHL